MTATPIDLAAEFGTPLYVYDLDVVRARAAALRAALPYRPLQLLYAIKANPCPPVAKVLIEAGFGIDAVSPGEVALALRLGCPPERVLYTENNATDDDLRAAISEQVLVNCGSLDRLRRLGELGGTEAAIRINPDVGAAEHAHTLTAGPLTKFGIHHSQMDAVRAIEAETGIRVVGAHMHIGSNVLDAAAYAAAMAVILDAAKQLEHLRFIDFGGGLGVPYKEDQAPLDLDEVGRRAEALMSGFCAGYGRELELRLEPGRFLVAEAGQLLTTVAAVKTNPDGRCFVGTDTGFNHLIRPCMYGSYHPIANLSNPDGAAETVDVVGNICESGDIFARDRALAAPRVGDLLSIGFAGAYGMSMASSYCLRPPPAEVVVDGGTARLARRRFSPDEIIDQWEW